MLVAAAGGIIIKPSCFALTMEVYTLNNLVLIIAICKCNKVFTLIKTNPISLFPLLRLEHLLSPREHQAVFQA